MHRFFSKFTIKHRLCIAICVLSAWAPFLSLQGAEAAKVEAATPWSEPRVREHMHHILKDILHHLGKNTSETTRMRYFEQLLRHRFAMKALGRFVVTKAIWSKATPEQQEVFIQYLINYIAEKYSALLLLPQEEVTFRIVKIFASQESEWQVDVVFDTQPTPLNLSFYLGVQKDTLLFTEVAANSVSMSMATKQELERLVQKNGHYQTLANWTAALQKRQKISDKEPHGR